MTIFPFFLTGSYQASATEQNQRLQLRLSLQLQITCLLPTRRKMNWYHSRATKPRYFTAPMALLQVMVSGRLSRTIIFKGLKMVD